jgi:hypothetical protein
MRVSKWVDFGQEIDIDIELNDVTAAIAEAFERVTKDRFDEGPTSKDVTRAINLCGMFLKAVTDEQISMLSPQACDLVVSFLREHADRYERCRAHV